MEFGWDNVPNWVCLFVHRKQGFLFMWMSLKRLESSRIWSPCGRTLMQNIVLDEPTSFLDHVCLGCTQGECKTNETIIEQYTKMFESRLPEWQAHTVASSYDLKDMLKNVSSGTVNWQIRKCSKLLKSRVLVWMITNSSRRNSNQLENCEMFARKLS